MVRDVTLDVAAHRIQSCIEASNDEMIDADHNDQGQTVKWVVKRGDFRYEVSHPDDAPHFTVQLSQSIVLTVASLLSEEDVDKVIQTEGFEKTDTDDQDASLLAAQYLLDNSPQEVKHSFGNGLVQLLSHPDMYFSCAMTDNGAITRYALMKNIFPFGEEFRYKEFDLAVQSIITIGHAASTYVQMCLDVEEAVDAMMPAGNVPYIQ